MGAIEDGADFLDAAGGGSERDDQFVGGIRIKDKKGNLLSQASILTNIGMRHKLFHDEGGDAYAQFGAKGRIQVLPIGSSDHRDVLASEFYRILRKGPSRNAVADAISTLTAAAKFDGERHPVFRRVGHEKDWIYIDLGDRDWTCFKIGADGWTHEKQHPVRFRRMGKPLALPSPEASDFSKIWRYVNINAQDRVLVAAWLLSALRPGRPCPILLLFGEQGTGKSSTCRSLKNLTDPSAAPLRAPPKDEKDMLIGANSSWVYVLDNLSGASAQMSDALCRLCTGGAHSARKLYSDDDEILIDIQRPVILNGIDDLASRPDLGERCIHLELPLLGGRMTEAELEEGFLRDAGAIMGAILDALSLAMRDHAHMQISPLPRMADFARWAAAGLPALGFTKEQFLAAYWKNQHRAVDAALEFSSLGRVLLAFMSRQVEWRGTSTALHTVLTASATDIERQSPSWPRSPKGLTMALRRLAPALRYRGILFEQDRDSEERTVTLRSQPRGQPSHPSSRPPQPEPTDPVTRMTGAEPHCTEADQIDEIEL